MESVEEMKGASRIVNEQAAVQPKEKVLIVGDWWSASNKVAERLAAAAKEAGAEVTMTLMDQREHGGNEPPDTVAAAMKEADVIFAATQVSISHSRAAAEARVGDTRWLSCVKLTPEELKNGALYADFEAMQPMVKQMSQNFTDAKMARVTSPQGTDATFDLTDCEGGMANMTAREPGTVCSPGSLEANTSPVTGSSKTEGTVVIDGAIPDLDIGEVDEKVVFEIVDGAVVGVNGGKEAKKIKKVWEEYDHPSVYNIAQLAVGMNPEVTEFDDRFLSAHGRWGNVHIGIGTNAGRLGGEVQAPVHFDAMMSEATLELDGEIVLENGEDFKL